MAFKLGLYCSSLRNVFILLVKFRFFTGNRINVSLDSARHLIFKISIMIDLFFSLNCIQIYGFINVAQDKF